ncbi:hypothetical protein OG884_11145 [Streptosporangium sp. NBC_01755]|uniref:hypothetical protein n=1 Tax=unclassified Streptosporangium TaxID=2632669 RepID=UPI002DDBA6AB|nr:MULTISPECIES: hypothetical protein [unclassified Streptosporangium]WSA26141.1 hypothetical protein OIE13_35530 [Streptosporangium sp. NBC_01810]WSD02429.1 hypothetical protein OG884_11145 [Streptosporangium sp. NBC_01755]
MPLPRDRQARVATWAAFFVQGLCFATLLTHVIDLQHRFGLSDGDLTLVLLLVPMIAGVGSAIAGLLASRFGVGLSIIAPQSFSAAGRLGAGAETAIARVNMFNYVGFLVGAAVVGTLNDEVNIRVAFLPAVVLVALIVFLARGFQPEPEVTARP